jgi:hypothetical protein
MPDDLYDRDALAWSERQAELLHRFAREESVDGIDWENVIEEIESVGRSQLHDVEGYLRQVLVRLLKVHGWPGLSDRQHWRSEMVRFQCEAVQRFAPSMRERIDLAVLYATAVKVAGLLRYGGDAGRVPPAVCPVTADQLLTASYEELEAAFSNSGPGGPGSDSSALA